MELPLPSFLVFTLLLWPSFSFSLNSDGLSLLALKSAISTDPTRSLSTWSESHSTPCYWHGITCNTQFRVTHIHLPDKRFSGYLPSELGTLTSLTHLSLSRNNFSKTLPSRLFNATSLTHLDLSHNSLSGPISPQIISLSSLLHVDLSSNLFNSSLPDSFPDLLYLSGTLNLSYNSFSGPIPPSFGRFPVTLSLDLRHNNLTGKIPLVGSLLNQGPTAFSGNPNLCGFPLRIPCPVADNADKPKIPQNPGSAVNPTNPSLGFSNNQKPRRGGSLIAISLICGLSFVIVLVFVSAWLLWKKWSLHEGKLEKDKPHNSHEDKVEEVEDGKYVVMDEGFGLELEDLLRASAYVVGKSRCGIVYKVVAVGGTATGSAATEGMVVAVRRLSEGGGIWRLKEFEVEMEAVGRIQHPNVVRLRAYYYATDEKLLVSDFISNGSLFSALHGEASDSLSPLPWSARLKIAQGVARGLTYIHDHNPRKYVHGSITSSKILLDNNLQPYISGFGLTRLVSSTNKSTYSQKQSFNHKSLSLGIDSKSSFIYLAPEARISSSRLTQKCDVYSFGVVLLELLTGRLPEAGPEKDDKELEGLVRRVFRDERPLSEIIDPGLMHEIQAKKQVLATFHVALNCTELVPEMRPRMKSVLESLERVESH